MTDFILYTQTTQCAFNLLIVGGLVSKVSLNCEAIIWSAHLYVPLFGRGEDLTSNFTRQPNNSVIHEFGLHLHLFSDSQVHI